ncbi:hypothetical protein JRI60_08750 [Archangium violaceum]|uniref:hypothetical protein n=1 Tax=Archangium violaceum TaxID=83451 RepID=UPI001950860E|nr:hypothetical protein [Archangium violaceum]QRN99091.1 hypothetical protein JRI60_08750 [Archangium violaceum]
MGRIVTAVFAIALIAGAAWYALEHSSARSSSAEGDSAPKRQLDNVRESASRIESDADQRAQELEEKMKSAQ